MLVSAQFLQRRYFPFPRWEHLTQDVRRSVLEAEKAWHELGEQTGRASVRAPETLFPHPLATASRALPRSRGGGAVEDDALPLFASRLARGLGEFDADAFIALLEDMATHLVGARQTVRRIPVATDPDRDGIRILFPRSGTLHGRITRLHQYLSSAEAPPLFLAAVALVAITNAHPFIDGNGRTSRLLFNLLINQGRRDRKLVAVRLHDLGNRPPGNLTLHMRSAELHGDWALLIRFLSAAIIAGDVRIWDIAASGQDDPEAGCQRLR